MADPVNVEDFGGSEFGHRPDKKAGFDGRHVDLLSRIRMAGIWAGVAVESARERAHADRLVASGLADRAHGAADIARWGADQIGSRKNEVKQVNQALEYLAKYKILPPTFGPKVEVEKLVKEQRWGKKG